MKDFNIKIYTLEEAVAERARLADAGLKLVVTNGCFDILHRGHAEYLMEARATADKLFVLVNSDASVRALKGPTRPVNNELDRAFLLSCLSFVDGVIIFDSIRCDRELLALRPDVYAKGGDYTIDSLAEPERNALLSIHAQICFIPFVAGYSTTTTLARAAKKPE